MKAIGPGVERQFLAMPYLVSKCLKKEKMEVQGGRRENKRKKKKGRG